jgi:uncharacterized protein (DUF39 family)
MLIQRLKFEKTQVLTSYKNHAILTFMMELTHSFGLLVYSVGGEPKPISSSIDFNNDL